MAPATAKALERAGYQHSAQALKGWVLFKAEPGPLARPLYWTGLLPLAVSRGAERLASESDL